MVAGSGTDKLTSFEAPNGLIINLFSPLTYGLGPGVWNSQTSTSEQQFHASRSLGPKALINWWGLASKREFRPSIRDRMGMLPKLNLCCIESANSAISEYYIGQ